MNDITRLKVTIPHQLRVVWRNERLYLVANEQIYEGTVLHQDKQLRLTLHQNSLQQLEGQSYNGNVTTPWNEILCGSLFTPQIDNTMPANIVAKNGVSFELAYEAIRNIEFNDEIITDQLYYIPIHFPWNKSSMQPNNARHNFNLCELQKKISPIASDLPKTSYSSPSLLHDSLLSSTLSHFSDCSTPNSDEFALSLTLSSGDSLYSKTYNPNNIHSLTPLFTKHSSTFDLIADCEELKHMKPQRITEETAVNRNLLSAFDCSDQMPLSILETTHETGLQSPTPSPENDIAQEHNTKSTD